MTASGPALDRYFDFRVTPGGDIATQSGVVEIEKDLSVLIAEVVADQSLGAVVTANDRLVLESRIQTAVLGHEDIVNVRDVTTLFDASDDLVEVSVTVDTDDDVVTASVTPT